LPSGEAWDPQTSAVTGVDGRYELAGIQAGVHRIYFVDEGGQFANAYYYLTLRSARVGWVSRRAGFGE